jgi:hypothetical protein
VASVQRRFRWCRRVAQRTLSDHRMITSGAGKGDIDRHKATLLLDKLPVQADNPA